MKKFNKFMKKICGVILACALIISPMTVMANETYPAEIYLPDGKDILKDKKIKRELIINTETASVNPWMYTDVYLTVKKTKDRKFNHAVTAFSKALSYFEQKKTSVRDGDCVIILNNGYEINSKNLKDEKTGEMARKEIYEKEFFKGDKLFTIGFISDHNVVVKETKWKLIDMMNLPSGSMNRLEKKFIVGITDHEQREIGKMFGFKTNAEVSSGIKVDKVISAGIDAKLQMELNQTISSKFTSGNTVHEQHEGSKIIQHGPAFFDALIIRYQLVDTYKVDVDTFRSEAGDIETFINKGPYKIVQIKQIGNDTGEEVPTDKVYDVVIKGDAVL